MKKNNNNSNNIPKDAIDKENSQFTFQCDNKIKKYIPWSWIVLLLLVGVPAGNLAWLMDGVAFSRLSNRSKKLKSYPFFGTIGLSSGRARALRFPPPS